MSPEELGIRGPVAVIGSGLIGTSVALSLSRVGVEVLLSDTDPQNVQIAVEAGAGRPLQDGDDPAIVVVAVPPRHTGRVLADASARWPEATLTDVASVKRTVLDDAIAHGADPRRLVGGHPMAGREVSGAAAALPNLMDDRQWVITPLAQSGVEHVRQVHRLAAACGALPVEMDPSGHDAAVALVSHTPQVLASALAGQLQTSSDDSVSIAGQGLRDMTRIAGSNVDLWTDILMANAAPVADVLDRMTAALGRTADALRLVADGSPAGAEGVVELLTGGVAGQGRIPGKHGAAPSAYREILVQVADRPGELGRLFTAAAEVDINLEDVRIEHVLGRPSGLVGLFVRPSAGDALIRALEEREFDVRG